MSKFFFSLLVSNTAPEKMSHEPLEAFVDNDEGCFFHPAILPLMPYLIDEERKLLDADDLDFIDEDAEPVGKFLTTKVPQIRPNCPIRSITSLISMEDAILSSRVPLGASKAAKKITIYQQGGGEEAGQAAVASMDVATLLRNLSGGNLAGAHVTIGELHIHLGK